MRPLCFSSLFCVRLLSFSHLLCAPPPLHTSAQCVRRGSQLSPCLRRYLLCAPPPLLSSALCAPPPQSALSAPPPQSVLCDRLAPITLSVDYNNMSSAQALVILDEVFTRTFKELVHDQIPLFMHVALLKQYALEIAAHRMPVLLHDWSRIPQDAINVIN